MPDWRGPTKRGILTFDLIIFFFEKRVKTFICRCVFDLVVCGLFKSCFVVYRWQRIRRSQLVESQTKNWRLGLKIVEVKISDKK